MNTQDLFELRLMKTCAYCKSGAPCIWLDGTPCAVCAQSANHPKQPKTIKGRKAPDGMYVPVMELGASCDKWSPTRFDSHKAQWLKEIGVMD